MNQQQQERRGPGQRVQQRGPASGADQQGGDTKKERPKRESIMDLSKFLDKSVHIKFQGGREAIGKLKGYDPALNLVLEDTVEYLRDSEDSNKLTETKRKLGLVVCRGAAVTVVCPQDGHEPIQNPFLSAD